MARDAAGVAKRMTTPTTWSAAVLLLVGFVLAGCAAPEEATRAAAEARAEAPRPAVYTYTVNGTLHRGSAVCSFLVCVTNPASEGSFHSWTIYEDAPVAYAAVRLEWNSTDPLDQELSLRLFLGEDGELGRIEGASPLLLEADDRGHVSTDFSIRVARVQRDTDAALEMDPDASFIAAVRLTLDEDE